MKTWIIYYIDKFGSELILSKEFRAYDIQGAICASGLNSSDIFCIKLKIASEAIQI